MTYSPFPTDSIISPLLPSPPAHPPTTPPSPVDSMTYFFIILLSPPSLWHLIVPPPPPPPPSHTHTHTFLPIHSGSLQIRSSAAALDSVTVVLTYLPLPAPPCPGPVGTVSARTSTQAHQIALPSVPLHCIELRVWTVRLTLDVATLLVNTTTLNTLELTFCTWFMKRHLHYSTTSQWLHADVQITFPLCYVSLHCTRHHTDTLFAVH